MDYGSINAKVKAMRGRLLQYDDYYNLCQARSIDEFSSRLREYPHYAGLIDTVQASSDRSRHGLEQKLILLIGQDYYKLYNFIGDQNIKKYLKAYVLKKEIHIMKRILCSLYDERDLHINMDELTQLNQYDFKFNPGKLLEAVSIREFIDRLGGTEFYSILDTAYYDGISLFELETKLDFYYYSKLWKSVRKYLKGKNRRTMAHINGCEIDIQNILWIYRLKVYYHMPADQIYQYLVPIHYRLQAATITRLAEAATTEELENEIRSTPYGAYFQSSAYIEGMYYQVMYHVFKSALTQDGIGLVVNYLYHKQLELDNIISAVEGVRYALNSDKILSFLYIDGKREVAAFD